MVTIYEEVCATNAKVVFSTFVSSKLKKRIEMKSFHHQLGSKPSGAEAMI